MCTPGCEIELSSSSSVAKVPGIRGGVRSIFGGREFGSRTEGRGRGCAEEEDPQRRRDVGGRKS